MANNKPYSLASYYIHFAVNGKIWPPSPQNTYFFFFLSFDWDLEEERFDLGFQAFLDEKPAEKEDSDDGLEEEAGGRLSPLEKSDGGLVGELNKNPRGFDEGAAKRLNEKPEEEEEEEGCDGASKRVSKDKSKEEKGFDEGEWVIDESKSEKMVL